MRKIKLEYIWIDGQKPTSELRSKTKVISIETPTKPSHKDLPEWSFDGSSTKQAEGNFSDCILKPVSVYNDPFRKNSYLVMCEVLNVDGTPHESNTRHILSDIEEEFSSEKALFGIEQEYILQENTKHSNFYKWYDNPSDMDEQGRYYCGVGSDRALGREIAEEHMERCLNAGLGITGINAEVMASQWEFQVGTLPALEVSDQLWVARWILHRVCENYHAVATLEPKPMKEWNGSGAHINFSTEKMREEGGIKYIEEACERLGEKHKEHINVYGDGNAKRLTGDHETCSIEEFRYGVSDRGASIRIPGPVSNAKRGYLEDRRPSSNVDPYIACAKLIETTCMQEEMA